VQRSCIRYPDWTGPVRQYVRLRVEPMLTQRPRVLAVARTYQLRSRARIRPDMLKSLADGSLAYGRTKADAKLPARSGRRHRALSGGCGLQKWKLKTLAPVASKRGTGHSNSQLQAIDGE